MLRTLLEAGQLTCPACRAVRDGVVHNAPLALDVVHAEAARRVEQGLLRCTSCAARYPVIDGVAAIFADTGAWLRQQERPAMWRDDLDPALDRWLRGAWADDQDPNWHRQMLAVYAAELAADDPDDALTAAVAHLRDRGRAFRAARLDALIAPGAMALDAGCAVGAAALDMASRGASVLAIDHDMGALRLLSRLLRDGEATAPAWRHGGGDYVSRTLRLPEGVDPARVAVVAADLLAPPFAARSFDVAVAWHVLDNVANPVTLVRQLHAALRPGGTLSVASPFDWYPACTDRPHRLGEGDGGGDPAASLQALLTGGLSGLAPELAMRITQEEPALPWVLLRHRRSAHVFLDHYVEAVRPPSDPGGDPTVKR